MKKRWLFCLGLVACLAGVGAAWRGGAVTAPLPNPEDGRITDGAYVNEYLGLAYALPAGWTAGMAGPPPSESGYYVLGTSVPKGELTGTILMAAQDMFFAAKPQSGAAEMIADFREAMSKVEGMTIEDGPSGTQAGGRVLHRVDFSGVGLHRAMFATEVRCHLVTFTMTASDVAQLAALALTVNNLSFAGATDSGPPAPTCVYNYAVAENLLHRVEPVAVSSRFTSIPARITIGADGGVKRVHVIVGSSEQRKSIETALYQWKFKPYEKDGRPVEIETGVMFRFAPGQS
jgi:Gram-negative bacterial TonB protein C-terminal